MRSKFRSWNNHPPRPGYWTLVNSADSLWYTLRCTTQSSLQRKTGCQLQARLVSRWLPALSAFGCLPWLRRVAWPQIPPFLGQPTSSHWVRQRYKSPAICSDGQYSFQNFLQGGLRFCWAGSLFLFVLFPILLLLPSFYKCWSLINILHLRLHLSVSEVTVVFRSGVRKQAIRWFQSWITYAQLAMNVSSLVEVKHQPPLAQSGSPVIKTFTGGKLGGCTSALGTAYQVFETYRRNSSYNTIRWLFLSAIDTLKKDIIQWRVSDSQLKSRYERSEPLWLHTYKEVLIIHREGQKKMRIKLST